MAQLVEHLLILTQVTISRTVRLSPTLGSVLTVWSLLGILSLPLSLSAPPLLIPSLFLSLKIDIFLKLSKKRISWRNDWFQVWGRKYVRWIHCHCRKQACSYQKHSGANLSNCHYYKYGNMSTSKNINAIDWNNNYVNVHKFLMTHFFQEGRKRKERGDWVSQSVKYPTLYFGSSHDPAFREMEP